MASFLRWAGSKRQLLSVLTQHIGGDFSRYVEPFAGSACVFFDLKPHRAVLGDINDELIYTYLQVKYRVNDIIGTLRGWRKSKWRYLELRATEPETLAPPERAARFIYLNRCCFNGLYRTNRKGRFNVPYGGKGSGKLPDADTLRVASKALQAARLVRGDFTKTLQHVERGDFVYMDPPFSITSRRMFNEYDAAAFDASQLEQLQEEMARLARRRIKFLVSYADSKESRILRKGFNSVNVLVRRNIAGFGADRRGARETLIYN